MGFLCINCNSIERLSVIVYLCMDSLAFRAIVEPCLLFFGFSLKQIGVLTMKTISIITAFVLAFSAQTGFAADGVGNNGENGKKEKIDICHQGSTFDADGIESEVYYVITVSENAKGHLKAKEGHLDCVDATITLGTEDSLEVCDYVKLEDGTMGLECELKTPCSCNAVVEEQL